MLCPNGNSGGTINEKTWYVLVTFGSLHLLEPIRLSNSGEYTQHSALKLVGTPWMLLNSFYYNLELVQSKTLSPFYAVLPFCHRRAIYLRWPRRESMLVEHLLLQGFTAADKNSTQRSICGKNLKVVQRLASFCWTITTSSQLSLSKCFVCGSPPISQTAYICRGQRTISLSVTVLRHHILIVFKAFREKNPDENLENLVSSTEWRKTHNLCLISKWVIKSSVPNSSQ